MGEWTELKGIVEVADSVAAGEEIECKRAIGRDFEPWAGCYWFAGWLYRARPRKPAKVLVKSICWRHKTNGSLKWYAEHVPARLQSVRFPAGDIEGEVEE